jgi:pyridoxal phosphate enzyme (YggS family)
MAVELPDNIASIRDRITQACLRAGRKESDICLIAVSKKHSVYSILKAIESGIEAFGENKVQEAEEKIIELGREAAEWHLIGHLQSNKARKAVQLFDVIHTLDSAELATRLDRICEEEGRESLDVLIQLDLGGEETKSGVEEGDLVQVLECVNSCKNLNLRGLMTLPPYFEDPNATRSFFVRLRELRDKYIPGGDLSMGMSHDFEVAIEEGATMIRVGTAIFGKR